MNKELLALNILSLLKSKNYAPSNLAGIAAALKLQRKDFPVFRDVIEKMVKEGTVAHVKGDRYCATKDLGLVAGVIEFRQSGAASIRLENGETISVRREDTGVALHGDKVLARILDERFGSRRHRRREKTMPSSVKYARVIRIIERKRTKLIGTLARSMNFWRVVADDPKFFYDVIVADPKKSGVKPVPDEGDKVVVRLHDWQQRHINPSGEIVENLGKSHTPMSEYKAILIKYGLDTEFPAEVLAEVEKLPKEVGARDIEGRLDLRNEFVITIDPSDAKDFDDALSFRRLPGGILEIGVHIADVSYYVKPKTALDKEALSRGNSTYLVGTVLPMLPFELSNGLCSLVEGQDRLVKSVFLSFDAGGDCKKVGFANSVIRSSKRLTYEQAYAFLKENDLNIIKSVRPPAEYATGSAGRPLDEFGDAFLQKLRTTLRQMWSLASALRKKRMRKGSFDLEMPEVRIFCDKDGYAQKIVRKENNESHQLVEEFMLAANEAVARELFEFHIPYISRVHDEPDEEKLADLREYLEAFGIYCGDLTRRREIVKTLAAIAAHPQSYILKTQFLKSLKRAMYRASPDGHFGLMKHYYAHFTSPIRRYADFTVHRALNFYMQKTKLASSPKGRVSSPNQAALETVASHISKTEQNSTDAERESRKVKLLEFFERRVGTGESFEAVIAAMSTHGFFVELTESMAYGFVHMHTLRDDIYRLNAEGDVLRGRKTGKTLKVGDKIRVCVESVDLFKRQIDFAKSES
ncbi:MAG: RNB domain-containing ribonuclease [Opitutales bacterium]|nr:RNB domain-containing ribonuclease [Opitutales bacterium]